ncbi:MAG: hypothetical protein QXN87_06180 [Candidatus Bathyarchaeia archaeon]
MEKSVKRSECEGDIDEPSQCSNERKNRLMEAEGAGQNPILEFV